MTRISTSYFNQRGTNSILEQQGKLAEIQEQVASGRRIVRPSDDPSGSSQIVRLTQAIELNTQYQRNISIIDNRLSLEEITLESFQNGLIRIRELALQANNATLTQADRQAIAQEVSERLQELLALGNTRDANDEYLFSGFSVKTQPFSENPDGSFSYNGDQGQRQIQIASGRQVADSDNGIAIFMDIINGNGTFQAGFNNANTGSGMIDVGQLVDSASYVEDTYTITFVTNSNGNTGYNIIGASSGQIVPALPLNAINDAPDYVDSAAITFNGIETTIQGQPDVGDTFTISPSNKQDVFTTVSDLITAMEGGGGLSNDTQIQNAISHALVDLDQAFDNVLRFRTSIGARLNTIDDQQNVNETFLLDLQTTLSETQDLDYTSAITELQLRIVALESAQASFSRIQSLSLFEFI